MTQAFSKAKALGHCIKLQYMRSMFRVESWKTALPRILQSSVGLPFCLRIHLALNGCKAWWLDVCLNRLSQWPVWAPSSCRP